MKHPDAPAVAWEEFQAELASVLRVSPDWVQLGRRLIDDLGADSVALAEVVAYVVVDCGVKDLSPDLELVEWEDVTVGDLFAACETGTGASIKTGLRSH